MRRIAVLGMAMLCGAVNALRTRRQGFDYNFHNRVEPGSGGLYAFWLDTGACLYVGLSSDLGRRIYQHRMNEHNPRLKSYFHSFARRIEVSYVVLPEHSAADLRRLETKLIRTLRPLTNSNVRAN